METKKKRTSKEQFAIYIRFLEEYPVLIHGKLKAGESTDEVWASLVQELNSCGSGPTKLVLEWKKVFTEWKSQVRKRARMQKELSDIEKKLIHLTGKIAISGHPVEEIGLPKNNNGTNHDETEMATINNDLPPEDEEIFIQVVEEGENANEEWQDLPDQVGPNVASGTSQQKRNSKKKSGAVNVLLDEYKEVSAQQSEGLTQISRALLEIANAINRYCDIVEQSE